MIQDHQTCENAIKDDNESESFEEQKCKFCCKTFALDVNLLQHIRNHLKCIHCSQTFLSMTARNHHIQVKHNLKCEFCGKIITTKTGLKQHIRGVHEDISTYVCDTCGKKYKSKMALDYHTKYFHQGLEIEKKSYL